MASGLAIRDQIKRGLKKIGGSARPVSLRLIATAGGNARLGVGQVVTHTDTPVDPPPSVTSIESEEVATSGGLLFPGDKRFLFHGDLDEAVLGKSLIVYGTEVMRIISVDPSVIKLTVVAWQVVARTVKAG